MSMKEKMGVICLFGYPAAGKGTLLKQIQEQAPDKFIIVGTSEVLRKYDLLKDPKKLVPDEQVMSALFKHLDEIESENKDKERVIILDGLPRTSNQAEIFLRERSVLFGLAAHISRELAIVRAEDRIVCKKCGTPYTLKDSFSLPKVEGICDKCKSDLIKRKEDSKEGMEKRWDDADKNITPILEIFEKNNMPVLWSYSDSKITVNELLQIL